MAELKPLERTLKALANRKRLEIIVHLKKPHTLIVSEIARLIDMKIHAASKHLRILTTVGIVETTKRGLFVSYRLSLKQDDLVKTVLRLL